MNQAERNGYEVMRDERDIARVLDTAKLIATVCALALILTGIAWTAGTAIAYTITP